MPTIRAPLAVARALLWLTVIAFFCGTLLRAAYFDYSDHDTATLNSHFISSVVAKNIHAGLGWATTGYETFPLNPDSLATGPAVIAPLVLGVALWGHTLAASTLPLALLNLSLLALLILQARALYPRPWQRVALLIALFALFASLAPHYWYRGIGQTSALMLLLNAAFWLARSLPHQFNKRAALVAGTLAGLAAASEPLVIPACAGLALAVLADSQLIHNRRDRSAWYAWILLCTCMALPLMAFGVYQQRLITQLDPAWWTGTAHYRSLWSHHHYGIDAFNSLIAAEHPIKSLSNACLHWMSSIQALATHAILPWALWALWPLLLIAGVIIALRQYRSSPISWLLFAMGLPLLLWSLFLNPDTGLRYNYIALSLLISACITSMGDMKPAHATFGAAVISVLLITCSPDALKTATHFPLQPSAYAKATNDISHYIEQRADDPLGRSGLTAINGPEFLSSRHNIFFNETDRIVKAVTFDEAAYRAAYPQVNAWIEQGRYANGKAHFLDPNTPRGFSGKVRFTQDVAFDIITFKAAPKPWRTTGQACTQLIYQNSYYLVEHCTRHDFEHMLEMAGGLPFRPQAWLRPTLIYPTEHAFF